LGQDGVTYRFPAESDPEIYYQVLRLFLLTPSAYRNMTPLAAQRAIFPRIHDVEQPPQRHENPGPLNNGTEIFKNNGSPQDLTGSTRTNSLNQHIPPGPCISQSSEFFSQLQEILVLPLHGQPWPSKPIITRKRIRRCRKRPGLREIRHYDAEGSRTDERRAARNFSRLFPGFKDRSQSEEASGKGYTESPRRSPDRGFPRTDEELVEVNIRKHFNGLSSKRNSRPRNRSPGPPGRDTERPITEPHGPEELAAYAPPMVAPVDQGGSRGRKNPFLLASQKFVDLIQVIPRKPRG